jgi:hypothetical protein
VDSCPKAEPQEQGVSPYVPLQAGFRGKKQSLTHILLHVTLLAISYPQYYVTFMFQFFKFYLSAMPSLPLLHYQNTDLSLFWSFSLLHHSPLWCLPMTCVGMLHEPDWEWQEMRNKTHRHTDMQQKSWCWEGCTFLMGNVSTYLSQSVYFNRSV